MTYLGMIGPWQTIIILTLLFSLLPTIIALVDILKSNFKGNDKLVWVLVVLFLNLIGAILYFIIGRKQKVKTL